MKRVLGIFVTIIFVAGLLMIDGCLKPNGIYVSFDENGGYGRMRSQRFKEGIENALTLNAFTNDGYDFAWWNTIPDGTGISYSDGQVISITNSIRLYAQWSRKEYSVTFDANGGSGIMEPQIFEYYISQSLAPNTFTRDGYMFCGWYSDEKDTYNDGDSIEISSDITLHARWFSIDGNGDWNGHKYVDMGLPSGTLWATANVGAESPEDFGNYYAWGETEPKDRYLCDNYAFSYVHDSQSGFTKYCTEPNFGYNGFTDNLTALEDSDDAAYINWNGYWRMPTYDEIRELSLNSAVSPFTLNGINGTLCTGLNGNSIFLPHAGSSSDGIVCENSGYYWSKSLSLPIDPPYRGPDYAFVLKTISYNGSRIDSHKHYFVSAQTDSRFWGNSVRPVVRR